MKLYKDYSEFLSEHFSGKIQKISVDAGLSCPNRDGTISTGGCAYCNNATFSPAYTKDDQPVAAQLARGVQFFAHKYPHMRYLAYFQSFTSTHGDPDILLRNFKLALDFDGVEGLIIGTRPDCIPDNLLQEIASLKKLTGKFIMFEFGAESCHNRTLKAVNRGHTWEQTVDAVARTRKSGFPVGLHFINGLPGESTGMMLETVEALNKLDIDTVKFHQLQVVSGTRLAVLWERGDAVLHDFTLESYIDHCCDIVGRLRKGIAIDRFTSQSPDNLLLSPRWGIKNYEFVDKLNKRLVERGITQGCFVTSST
ncbi:MAG: TIGR01212 family radical SAM protein [Muribaculum sp.]|nr:TIGR01212 family radical SAM protein [Muribaculaceae bacterium]MCM1081630.1 TIGR01212 family radical SAM protein [Muribaculum sp.]